MTEKMAHIADTVACLIRQGVRGDFLENEPLSRHTSLRVGGPADLFLVPADQEDLLVMLDCLEQVGMPCMVIGGGFNLLVRDGGVHGAVIALQRLNKLERRPDDRLFAEAGVSNQQLTRFCIEQELAGLEFLCGIPGTVGGALCMNAGAHGGVVMGCLDTLLSCRAGQLGEVSRSALTFGYRYLNLQPGEIIVGGTFHLAPLSRQVLEVRIAEYQQYRREHQRVTEPNAGSFFKNPRGTRVGGAKIAEAHANYLVNAGEATAADFLELAAMVKTAVWDRFGVQLEEEVRIVGVEQGK
jgi:UDP-N-acetylmuramate dehydrogenase